MRDISDSSHFSTTGRQNARDLPMCRLVNYDEVLISNIVASNVERPKTVLYPERNSESRDRRCQNQRCFHPTSGRRPSTAGAGLGCNPPEVRREYPEPNMFGTTPAQGFYLRHMQNIDMSHIEITSAQGRPDAARPGFVLDDVKDADFSCASKTQRARGSSFLFAAECG